MPTLVLSSAARPLPGCGVMMAPLRAGVEPPPPGVLVFQGSEGCPGSRLVREALCSLQLPYTYKPCFDFERTPRLKLDGGDVGRAGDGDGIAIELWARWAGGPARPLWS